MPGRFRKVCKDSVVDETLFGSTKKTRRSKGPTNVISKDYLAKTTISSTRLRDIKARAELVTAKDVEAMKKKRQKGVPSTKRQRRERSGCARKKWRGGARRRSQIWR